MMMATCFKALLWSFLLCFVVMTVWAMLLVELVYPIVTEMHRIHGFFEDCPQCTKALSSVPWWTVLIKKMIKESMITKIKMQKRLTLTLKLQQV